MPSDDLENHFFVIMRPRASFRYKICPGLKKFGFWPQMTPNTPKWPPPQFCKIENLYLALSFNLSHLKLWLVNYVTRYFKNKSKLKVAHETGSRTNFENFVGTFDCFDQKNLSAKFHRDFFVKSTHLGNFAAEIGVWELRSRKNRFGMEARP